MQWKEQYALGIASIDAQHKQLFYLSSELEESLKKGLNAAQLTTFLARLGQYTICHFALEERIMASCAYPGLVMQQQEHGAFLARFKEIERQFQEEGLQAALPGIMHHEISEWIKQHVTGLDKAFGIFYHDRQQ